MGTLEVKMLSWETARAAFFWARVCFISFAVMMGDMGWWVVARLLQVEDGREREMRG